MVVRPKIGMRGRNGKRNGWGIPQDEGANKLKDTRGKAWEPQAYVIVSTLRR